MIYPESGWYLAASSGVPSKYHDVIGQMESAIYTHRTRLLNGCYWGIDNGVFTDKFEVSRWIRQVESLRNHMNTCLFVVIPDVVGSAKQTLESFYKYRSMIKDFPVAFVSQDGIKKIEKEIPWDLFDCLFVGGSDEHKLREEGAWALEQGKQHNKWVHIGRVNSPSRILKFWKADSWDGNTIGFSPSNAGRIHAAVLQVRAMKAQRGMFE